MDDSLSISWEGPAQPNDYTLNYTVSVTDISTDAELSRTVLKETQLIVTLSDTPCTYMQYPLINNVIYSEYSFIVRGVPLSVTVFATNGRGNGESVSEVVHVEEDGMWKGCSAYDTCCKGESGGSKVY